MFSSLVFATILFLIWLIYLIFRNHSYMSYIPMPNSNIIFGHIFYFLNTTDLLQKITNMTVENGGIVRIYIPPIKPTVIITNPNIIREITRSEKMLDKANYYKYFSEWIEEGLLTTKLQQWKPNRKMITPWINKQTILMNFMKIFESKCDILIENFEQQLGNPDLDVTPIVKIFSMDVTCECLMGVNDFDDDFKRNYFNSIFNIGRTSLNRMVSPFKRFDIFFELTRESRSFEKELKNLESVFEELITRRRKNAEKSETDGHCTFLDFMLQMKDTHSIKYIREEVTTMLFAGHDTISTAISFILYALSRHPEIQENVYDEQIDIIGNENVTYAEIQQMKYLDMVINETMRMYPPVPLIGRKVEEDVVIAGKYLLPKNHSVGILIYGCHHNPNYFPEPEKFIPERFQNEILPGTYLPFSLGPRNCIGKKFAWLEIKVCISKLIRRFRFLRPEPDYKIDLVPQMVLVAKNGIRLSLQKRVE
ncbi:cytochrome P450 4V2-like [Diorhabda carinulata]|uniref:cytochrome P450 4V2-like n=1 Tax=Diorhabda carinulata TaxID=1163345 RepID=UPI0025A20F44|nr:cytochrome P450 4V2-like [Diorhabda carinulata]